MELKNMTNKELIEIVRAWYDRDAPTPVFSLSQIQDELANRLEQQGTPDGWEWADMDNHFFDRNDTHYMSRTYRRVEPPKPRFYVEPELANAWVVRQRPECHVIAECRTKADAEAFCAMKNAQAQPKPQQVGRVAATTDMWHLVCANNHADCGKYLAPHTFQPRDPLMASSVMCGSCKWEAQS